jgi:isochorismate pyruvate lyase
MGTATTGGTVDDDGTGRDATADVLGEVRGAIDTIDRRIVSLLAERQGWVERAGALKRDERGVRAPDRVEQVVATVRSDVVERTYRAMIAAFVDLELAAHRRRE